MTTFMSKAMNCLFASVFFSSHKYSLHSFGFQCLLKTLTTRRFLCQSTERREAQRQSELRCYIRIYGNDWTKTQESQWFMENLTPCCPLTYIPQLLKISILSWDYRWSHLLLESYHLYLSICFTLLHIIRAL